MAENLNKAEETTVKTEVKKKGRPSAADKLKKENEIQAQEIASLKEKFDDMMALVQSLKKDNDEKAEEIETLKEVKVSEATTTKVRKRVPKDIDVTIKSNIDGDFLYTHKSNPEASFRFSGYGDEDSVSLSGLIAINKESKWLKKGKIAITDVYSDEYDVEDIIKAVKLEKLYYGEGTISPSEIEKLFTDEVDYKELDDLLQANMSIIEAILEVAIIMKSNNELNDYAKISLLKQRTRNPALFK